MGPAFPLLVDSHRILLTRGPRAFSDVEKKNTQKIVVFVRTPFFVLNPPSIEPWA